MVLLQPRLSVKLSQRQILTPGLVQMVSVLALNKLELRDMITAEMVDQFAALTGDVSRELAEIPAGSSRTVGASL